jgi:hypothetical protein
VIQVSGRTRCSQIALQETNIRLVEIHHDQTIECVGEASINMVSDQFPAQLEVLFQQDGNALAVDFKYPR